MNEGGRDAPLPLIPPLSGGEFLLQLLHKHQPLNPQPHPSFPSHHFPNTLFKDFPPPPSIHDPAVAAAGLPSSFPPWKFSVHDLPPPVPDLQGLPSPFPPHLSGFPLDSPWSLSPRPPGFPCNGESNTAFGAPQFAVNECGIVNGEDDAQSCGLSGTDGAGNPDNRTDHNIMFGSFSCDIRSNGGLAKSSKQGGSVYKQQHPEFTRVDSNLPPIGFSHNPGFQDRQGGVGNLDDSRSGSSFFQPNVDNNVNVSTKLGHDVQKAKALSREYIRDMHSSSDAPGLSEQMDRLAPLPHFMSEGDEINEKMINSLVIDDRFGDNNDTRGKKSVKSLIIDDRSAGNIGTKQRKHHPRDRDERLGSMEHNLISQSMRVLKREQGYRYDIDRLNVPFLEIFDSLIPPETEKQKQSKLVELLEKLVCQEWPGARLYLYGSCANSFGFSKSDIDVCLVIEDPDIIKSEVLLKLADILKSDLFENVQALTRARVPIVKLRDPETEISCDICINNVLGVVNTKLLRDYAKIDIRLRQLAFIVKHWAKSRGVNETYKGTLSSYAYVIMCIHFLQQRRPAILPCLQGMKATYSKMVEGVHCCFFDEVDKLRGFGSRNKESIAQLVWSFFNYWAYSHDYSYDVISVRTGGIISKRAKDWTRRVGNDRHLICIEDPFVMSHDLGRVVDKFSIKLLREEFERAAEIMQHHHNPCVALFEPYKIIPPPTN